MTSTGDALLAAILERPHDDLPRLAYADWLDDHGDPPRAEFIRVQCALAPLDEWDDGREPLAKRESALWRKGSKAWKAGLPAAYQRSAGFSRGFPAPRLERMAAGTFLNLPADALDAAPLWDVILRPPAPTKLGLVVGRPAARRIGTLKLDGWLTSAAAGRHLADATHLGHLARLTLFGVADAAVAAAVAGPGLAGLTELELMSGAYGDAALVAVCESPLGGRLRRLALATAAGLDGLFAHPRPTALRRLDLPCSLSAAVVDVLATARPAFQLDTLDLHLKPPAAGRLADAVQSPALAGLRRLRLWFDGRLAADFCPAIDALADPAVLPRLERLEVNGWLSDARADRLRTRFGAGFRDGL